MAKYYETMWGVPVSGYALQHGYVDYHTLRVAFDCVLCNEIAKRAEHWHLENGMEEEYDDDDRDLLNPTTKEIFQYYIISESFANELEDLTDEIVYYDEEYDMYIWGVTHFGTPWTHVLTSIPLRKKEE